MSEWNKGDTPEQRRAWIESVTGYDKNSDAFKTLMSEIGTRRKREDVLAVASKLIGEIPVEKSGQVWVGDYAFTFDKDGNLLGAAFSATSGGVVIQSDGWPHSDT